MKAFFVISVLFLTALIIVAYGETTTYRPSPPVPMDDNLLSTGTGSYFEYAVCNVIRDAFYYPRAETNNRITDLEQMIYYYHLQMMHIDLFWIRNWQGIHSANDFPDIFSLPSRAVRYFYNTDVRYDFGDGEERTLDSHRLLCGECNRQFQCNVNHLHNHMSGLGSVPQILPTNDVADIAANRPLIQPHQQYQCQASQVITTSTTSTTEGNWDDYNKRHRYDVSDRDELKKK